MSNSVSVGLHGLCERSCLCVCFQPWTRASMNVQPTGHWIRQSQLGVRTDSAHQAHTFPLMIVIKTEISALSSYEDRTTDICRMMQLKETKYGYTHFGYCINWTAWLTDICLCFGNIAESHLQNVSFTLLTLTNFSLAEWINAFLLAKKFGNHSMMFN